MVATIVLNQNNIVNNGNNNTLIYKFPNTVKFPHHEIAVQSINMFYSWANISAELGNNKFTIYFPTPSLGIQQGSPGYTAGSTNTTIEEITIPDGLYEIKDLNNYIQFYCIQKGYFLINAAGEYVYFLEMVVNPTLYSIQIVTYPLPLLGADAGGLNGYFELYGSGTSGDPYLWVGIVAPYIDWTSPVANPSVGYSGFTGFPYSNGFGLNTITYSPAMFIPQGFNEIVGYPVGTYLANGLNTPYGTTTPFATLVASGIGTYQSSFAPNIQPNSSIYFAISNIQNKYSVPSSIIYALSPTVALGAEITEYPPQFAYNKLLEGNYNELRLSILGSNFQPLKILDPNMTILLVIRDTREIPTADFINKLEGGKG
jgi:hypothetical protein